VPAGSLWGEVVDALAPHGLTAMHGSSPSVGAVGYLLGGGVSFYARRHGLATNRVRSFDLVTADGEAVRASAGENPDLFWALRGGGGRFGVVTGVEIELLPFGEVFCGATFWPVESAAQVLETWLGLSREAPDTVTSTFRILRLPPMEEVPEPLRGRAVACVDGVALDQTEGQAFSAGFDGCGPPVMGGWGVQPSAAVGRLHGDPEEPLPAVGDGILLEDLGDADAEAFLGAAGEESDSSLVVAEIRHLGGALAEPDPNGGVLDHIDASYLLFGTGLADPGSAEATERDLGRLIDAMRPAEAGKRLYGFAESECSLSDCFEPDSVARLRDVRDRVDPDRLFLAPHTLD
jgi:FAD/FMN-containing dehydrogenase